MNEKEKQELKELIREVVREELAKNKYGFTPFVPPKEIKPKHFVDMQSVSVYSCPIIDETPSNMDVEWWNKTLSRLDLNGIIRLKWKIEYYKT